MLSSRNECFSLDLTDVIHVIEQGSYINIFTSFDEAIAFEKRGATSVLTPFTCLQEGYQSNPKNNTYWKMPILIPRFVIYKVSGIAPHIFFDGLLNHAKRDWSSLLAYVSSYTTNTLTSIPDTLRQNLVTLAVCYSQNANTNYKKAVETVASLRIKEMNSDEMCANYLNSKTIITMPIEPGALAHALSAQLDKKNPDYLLHFENYLNQIQAGHVNQARNAFFSKEVKDDGESEIKLAEQATLY